MNKIKEFLKSNKYAVVWTICYVFVVWAIMLFMFGFNIFSAHHWHLLSRVSLHGFAPFVFGILLIASVPLYVATTAIIIRTKKPLINLPKIFLPKKDTEQTESDSGAVASPQEPEQQPFPDDLPRELYEPFLRARAHGTGWSTQNFDITDKTQNDDTPTMPDDTDLPLPPDFDIEPEFNSDSMPQMPVFSEINFGDDDSGN